MHSFTALSSPPYQADDRATDRRALWLAAVISFDGSPGEAAFVLDLSERGCLLQTDSTTCEGDIIGLTLPDLGPIQARVQWRVGSFVGCAFATPLSRSMLSAALLRARPQLPARPHPAVATALAATGAALPAGDLPPGIRAMVVVGVSLILWWLLFWAVS